MKIDSAGAIRHIKPSGAMHTEVRAENALLLFRCNYTLFLRFVNTFFAVFCYLMTNLQVDFSGLLSYNYFRTIEETRTNA